VCEKIGFVGRGATAPSMGMRCDTGHETISEGDAQDERLAEYDNCVGD
jgi:hypothetical protein